MTLDTNMGSGSSTAQDKTRPATAPNVGKPQTNGAPAGAPKSAEKEHTAPEPPKSAQPVSALFSCKFCLVCGQVVLFS